MSSDSYPLKKWLGLSLEEICSQWYWRPCSGSLNNSEFMFTLWLAWNALPFADWAFKAGLADLLNCSCCSRWGEETAEHAFANCEWTAHIDSKWLVLLDVGYIMGNFDPPWKGEKRRVFLTFLAVAKMVIWMTRKKELYEGANFSDRDLTPFLGISLNSRSNAIEKALTARWVYATILVVRKREMLEASFTPLPAHDSDGLGILGLHLC